ncbi:MAG: tetratricopeptide repeat protein [Tateyamaria sp.]
MRKLMGCFIVALLVATSAQANDFRSQFKAIQAQEQSDPRAAVAAMRALADAGFAPAANRVGYYFRHGLGTEQDLVTARHWYQRAVSGGHPWAFASLARVELALGHADAALDLLQQAAEAQRPGAARVLGTAHIDGVFGAASDPALGRRILIELERAGDAHAARDLIMRHNWSRLQGPAPDAVVARVVNLGLEGDARFAEAALVYLTRQPDNRAQVIAQRDALLAVPGIQRKTVLIERVRFAADTRAHRFWLEVEQVLQDAEAEHYARVASAAFWIKKNAWIRVLQKELRALGYYSGRINAQMTTRTIRAQNRFCRDTGIWDVCATGPLRGATVKAVATAIGSVRARPTL